MGEVEVVGVRVLREEGLMSSRRRREVLESR